MRFFSRKPVTPPVPAAPEHAVLLHYALSDDGYGAASEREAVFALEERVAAIIDTHGLGEHDGNELGGGEAVIYCYGPDAARLFAAIEAEARAFPARPAHAVLRFGPPGDPTVRTERVEL